MEEKFFKRTGFFITVGAAAVALASGVISAFLPSDWVIRTVLQICAGIGAVMTVLFIIIYLVKWLETGIRNGKLLESIHDFSDNLNILKDISGIGEQVSNLAANISALEATACGLQNTCDTTRSTVTECQSNILLKLDSRSRFKYNTIDVTKELSDLLDSNKNIEEIRIICFGRSGYGDIVQHISEKSLNINVSIIVCNPKRNKFICRKDDEEKINQHIKHMLENDVTVFVSDIPPAIRASAVYVKGNPIWCAIQSYQFEKGESGKIEMVRPKESLIVTCNEGSSKSDFDGIVKCFENEYTRLENLSTNPTLSREKKVLY